MQLSNGQCNGQHSWLEVIPAVSDLQSSSQFVRCNWESGEGEETKS